MPRLLKRRIMMVFWLSPCFLGFVPRIAVAQSPELQPSPAELYFGDVFLGDSSTLTITLANTGNAPLDFLDISLGAGSSTEFTLPEISLPITAVPGGRLVLRVTFTPESRGLGSGSLRVESTDPIRPVITVPIAGRGEISPDPQILVSLQSLEFGGTPVGSTSGRTVTLRNGGFGPLTVSRLSISQGMDRAFRIGGDNSLPLVLEGNKEVQVRVLYAPLEVGTDFGRLVVESDDLDDSVINVSLIGQGISVTSAEITVRPSSLDFGEVLVGIPVSQYVTIANAGLRQLEIAEIGFDQDSSPSFAVVGRRTNTKLTTGDALTVEVIYTPSSETFDTGTLQIRSNDANSPLATVAVSGTGVMPVFRRSDANSDGVVDLSDAISILGQLFGTVSEPLCLDASDSNDDATVDVSDAVFTLVWLFGEDNVLPAPGAETCGVDLTDDEFAPCTYPAGICE